MEMVTLKNGSEEAKVLVAGIKLSVLRIWDDNPLAIYDLHSACKDSNYEPFGDNGATLKKLSLMEPNGGIHQSIKNVVLSMVEGEGMEKTLVSPVASL